MKLKLLKMTSCVTIFYSSEDNSKLKLVINMN